MALRGNISAPVQVMDLVEASKDALVFWSAIEKIFFPWGVRVFVSDVISGRLLGHLGPLCLALGANRQVVVFC